jgi:hypothetical protein
MQQTLVIDGNKARRLYPSAPQELKKELETTFGPQFFSQKITDRVQSIDDLFAISGKRKEEIIRTGEPADENAHRVLKLVAEVYNEGTVLDPNDEDQYKYYNFCRVTRSDHPSGFCLSLYGVGYWRSFTRCGVRLCFKNSDLARDAFNKFRTYYEDFYIR